LERQTVGTGCCFINSKEHRDSSSAARKVLADTTKQFKRSVKAAEVMTALNTSNTPETATQTVTDVESLVQKKCKVTVKAYGEKLTI
jgi:hypothetical protein